MARFIGTALLFLVACMSTATASEGGGVPLRESVPHIVTTGSASAEVVPDQANIRLGVEIERSTADAATTETAKAATAVINEIKAHGIDARDIKTRFDLAAQYDYIVDPVTHAGHQTFRNYKATETLVVRLRDVSKAGSLARDLIAKGANDFQGIDYAFSQEKAVRRRLQGEAIRDALAGAKAYTDAVNLTLGRVLQIGGEIQAGNGEADVPVRRATATMHTAIPTEPGVQNLTESVSVIWEIEGKAR